MKLAIIIPAYNESDSIASVLQRIQQEYPDVSKTITIVVDDGSTDDTQQIARDSGADFVVVHSYNKGLAEAFRTGMEQALNQGADIIVNIDADGQHAPEEISELIKPIQAHEADFVVGNRGVKEIADMAFGKRVGNMIGNWVVGVLTKQRDIDVSSGFRAFSREAALRLNVFFGHTHTHQTIIEAAYKRIKIASVPISYQTREGHSRLIKGLWSHITNSIFIIIRTLLIYKPLRTFGTLGSIFIAVGFLLGVRYLIYFYVSGPGRVQSLILMTIIMSLGFMMFVIGFLGDLIAINRKLNEELYYQMKKSKYDRQESE